MVANLFSHNGKLYRAISGHVWDALNDDGKAGPTWISNDGKEEPTWIFDEGITAITSIDIDIWKELIKKGKQAK